MDDFYTITNNSISSPAHKPVNRLSNIRWHQHLQHYQNQLLWTQNLTLQYHNRQINYPLILF